MRNGAEDGVTRAHHGTILDTMAQDWRDRITADPTILVGKRVVRGTRFALEFVLDLIAAGWTSDEILANYLPRRQVPVGPPPTSGPPGEERLAYS